LRQSWQVVVPCLVLVGALAVSDYHARQGETGNLGHLVKAAIAFPTIETQSGLTNGLLKRLSQATEASATIGLWTDALASAQKAVRTHPHESVAYDDLATVLAIRGLDFQAYAAESRAVALDPTLAYYRIRHVLLARLVHDKSGEQVSLRMLQAIKHAELKEAH
jgi:tetratricopeptide (TPR) repeat protein